MSAGSCTPHHIEVMDFRCHASWWCRWRSFDDDEDDDVDEEATPGSITITITFGGKNPRHNTGIGAFVSQVRRIGWLAGWSVDPLSVSQPAGCSL